MSKATPRSADQILADKAKANEGKKVGGRPPGRKNNATLAKEAAERQAATNGPATPSLDEQLNKLKVDYPPAPEPARPATATQQAATPPATDANGVAAQQAPTPDAPAFTISGHLALIVIDALIPTALVWLLNRYGGYDGTLKKSDLQLTPKEVEDLTPIADQVAKRIMADPLLVLCIALLGCYAGKIPPKPAKKEEPVKPSRK